MAYTPELSQHHSATLRRIAWAMQMPMTKTLEDVFDYLGQTLDPVPICSACRDKTRCTDCPFSRKGDHHAQSS
jgi:hypothetical protein